jgi:hypothetical protein
MACRRDLRMDDALRTADGQAYVDNYVSPDMEWGIENEPLARTTYELQNKCELKPSATSYIRRFSGPVLLPDGLVGVMDCWKSNALRPQRTLST